ncbi:MAG: PAS domain S-box protein [Stellaceae bacterium]
MRSLARFQHRPWSASALAAIVLAAAGCYGIAEYYRGRFGAGAPGTLFASASVVLLAAACILGLAEMASLYSRRLAEATKHTQDMLDSMLDGVVIADELGCIEVFNQAAERIFNYGADEVIGQNLKVLMPAPYHGEHDTYVANYRRTGHKKIIGIGREVVGRRKDGTVFPLDLAISETVAHGRRKFIGTIRDISQRKAAEDRLRQSQKMEAIGQLTGGVAHDFNNRLAAMMTNLEVLEDQVAEDPAALASVRDAIKSVLRGAQLTHHLLAFSRQQPLRPEVVDLNELLGEIKQLLFRRTFEERVHIKRVSIPGLWHVSVDRAQIEHALLNTVLNARDAMPDGGTVTIETRNVHLDDDFAARHAGVMPGDYVLLAVTDTGVGMAQEVLDRVFEPFFTTKEAGKGSGLGLSMVYGFVKQSRGHIDIESQVGQGTAVMLYLPKAVSQERMPKPEATPSKPARGDETILLVDDDEDVRRNASAMLRNVGYRVLEAEDGAAALRAIADSPTVDLLITDVGLPNGMRGPELAWRALSTLPSLKVIYISGYLGDGVHGDLANSEIPLVTKPFRKAELSARIRSALDGRIA